MELREIAEQIILNAPPMEIRGEGTVKHPPDAIARVRAELAATADPVRRAEIEAVLRDLGG